MALPALAQQSDEDDQGEGLVPALPRRVVEENRIKVPEYRDHENSCRRAEAAAAAGEWTTAVRTYLDVLRQERDPDGGIQHVVKVGDKRWLSYARFVRERLLRMPAEGRKAFREQADAEARALFDDAVARRDARGLDAVWRTFPLATCAAEALERLGDMAFEAGDFGLAAIRYERAGALPDATVDPKRIASKVALAKARLAAASAAAPETAPVESWPVIGGNNAHAALLPPLDGIAPQPRLACRFEGQGNAAAQRAWGTRPRSMRRFDMSYGGFTRDDVYSEMLPVAEDGKLVVTTPNSIACYAIGPQGGERLWYQGPPPPSQSGATVGAGLLWPHADLNADIYYSATIAGGRVFASYIKTMSKFDSYRGIPIQEPIATRRLLCFDLRTGKVLWDHAQSPDEFLLSASVPLPPVVRDGMVFASAILGTLRREGAFKCYLIACDAATGKLLWKRFLGSAQMELTMFGEPAREPFAMQPAERNGIVYCCSGMGTIIAASALTGDVEWEVAYDTIPIEPARTYYAVMRDLVWRNEPPLVADGTLVVTPIDSDKAYAFDAATGELRWSFDGRQTSMRRLLGVDAGKAIFQGDRILAQDIRTGKRVLEFPRDAGFGEEETGRGLICGGVALVPLSTRVARVDLRRGERLAELPIAGGIRDSGALLYLGKDLITVNPQRASVYQTISAPAAPAPAGAR